MSKKIFKFLSTFLIISLLLLGIASATQIAGLYANVSGFDSNKLSINFSEPVRLNGTNLSEIGEQEVDKKKVLKEIFDIAEQEGRVFDSLNESKILFKVTQDSKEITIVFEENVISPDTFKEMDQNKDGKMRIKAPLRFTNFKGMDGSSVTGEFYPNLRIQVSVPINETTGAPIYEGPVTTKFLEQMPTRYSLTLSEGLTSVPIVNQTNPRLDENTTVQVFVNVPPGKLLDKFLVNGADKKDEVIDNVYTFKLNENTTIVAEFADIPKYAVLFEDPTGGALSAKLEDGSPVTSGQTFTDGTLIIFNVVTQSGYIVDEWTNATEDEENNKIAKAEISGEDLKVSVTLKRVYNVTINSLINGNITADPTEAPSDTTVTLTVIPENGFRLKENTLKVVTTGESILEIVVTPDEEDQNKYTFEMPESDVAVSAEFEKIPTYTLTFNGNENTGGNPPEPEQYAEGAEVTLPNEGTLVKEGYQFLGWATTADATEALTEFTMPGQETTLYAVWKLIPKYTLTFDGNGNTGGNPPASEQYAEGAEVTLPDAGTLKKEEYFFLGWATTNNATEALTEFTMPGEETTLYAVWSKTQPPVPGKTRIIYDLNGGTGAAPPPEELVEHNKVIIVKELPPGVTKGQAEFIGWEDINSTKVYLPGDRYKVGTADSATLRAVWSGAVGPDPTEEPQPIKFIVTFMNGDDIFARYTVEKGSVLVVPEEFVYKSGYIFTNWALNGVPIEDGMIVEEDLTLDAQFKKLPILIEEEGKLRADIIDVIVLLQYTAGTGIFADVPLEEMLSKGADVNNDGKIDITDVILFLKSI